jgi:hypothetical protein
VLEFIRSFRLIQGQVTTLLNCHGVNGTIQRLVISQVILDCLNAVPVVFLVDLMTAQVQDVIQLVPIIFVNVHVDIPKQNVGEVSIRFGNC